MVANIAALAIEREYRRIMLNSSGHGNDETYACMIASWQAGEGSMPDDFGLGEEEFNKLLAFHFPRLNPSSLSRPGRNNDVSRDDERDDVFKLLYGNRLELHESEVWMARIVASACQGQDHLWQDMGLWSRKQLSELLLRNFPDLAGRNVNNMKWKKFLYKQLCNAEGIYTCRAPSCEVCTDYDNCFGAEE